ncbi:MAG: primosomal protein N', partial [Clostridia bacterium]|nr:primosomal protein N' [Clostridia bacterium]
RKTGDATIRMVRIAPDKENISLQKLTPKQREVVELLSEAGSASAKEVCYFTGVTQAVITGLQKRGIVEYFDNEVYRKPYKPDDLPARDVSDIVLTQEQSAAYENMLARYRSGEASTTLLYGVTGSGKTSVFLKLIDDVVADGRGVIVMVPEIALTPQTLGRFRSRYGDKTAVFHSGLSLGQRMDEWKRVKRGEARIAVGTRSAVFAPFDDLGLVIIDEEQEYTYKSESTPRFHARDVARFRCAYNKCALVLASATPSIESYYYATEAGRYHLETLTSRYGDAKLPTVDVIDISEQRLSENIISPQLREALDYNLRHGYQSILLHNRRGFNTFVACRSCGEVLTCPHCSVSMTYHHDNGRLMCHYCGETMPFAIKCPSCGADQLRYAGQGTQRVEDELGHMFPDARILRMDADSTMTRFSHSDKLEAFSSGQYDIMIGTQMVAKGLDFERVTLVGVLMADQMLYSDDFRSFERAFSLLTQVVGRSGRGEYSGRAIIQTLTPENPVIGMAARQDYDEFFGCEIKVRRAMLYPPFSDICVCGFVGEEEERVKDASRHFLRLLGAVAANDYPELPMRVLGPSPASINKIGGKYRYKLIIKCRNTVRMRELMAILLSEAGKRKENKDIQVFADMNPDNVM